MQRRRLKINGRNVDLSGASRIGVTLQANNLAELQNRQGDFSNLFVLPYTPANRALFEDAENVNSATLVPYRKNSATYEEDGIFLVDSGSAEIESADTAKGYKVKITGGNTEFFNLLPDVKVYELDWSALDHIRNFTNVTTSRANTSGVIYPIINWLVEDGTEFNTPLADPRDLYPCLFLKDVFERLEVLTGYKFKGSFISSDEYENILIAPKGLQTPDELLKALTSEAKNSTPTVYTGPFNPVFGEWNFPFNFDENTNHMTAGVFESPGNSFGYFTFRGAVTITAPGGVFTITWRFYDVDTNATLYTEQAPPSQLGIVSTYTYYFNIISNNLTVTPGQRVGVEAIGVNSLHGFAPTTQVVYQTDSTFKFNALSASGYNQPINAGALCDLKAKDLIKEILNARGLMVQTNALKKEIYLDYFDTIQETKATAPNWSDKIDPASVKVGYKFGKYAQRNDFNFKPSELVPVGLNDVFFEVDDETLAPQTTVINFATSTSEDETKFQNENVPHIRAKESGGNFTQTNYRLLILERHDVDFDFEYNDGTDSLVVSDNLPTCRALTVDIEQNYKTLTEILRKAKPIQARAKLSQDDVNLVKRREGKPGFLQAIYLDVHKGNTQINGYFYINKIDKYIDGFATLELIRL